MLYFSYRCRISASLLVSRYSLVGRIVTNNVNVQRMLSFAVVPVGFRRTQPNEPPSQKAGACSRRSRLQPLQPGLLSHRSPLKGLNEREGHIASARCRSRVTSVDPSPDITEGTPPDHAELHSDHARVFESILGCEALEVSLVSLILNPRRRILPPPQDPLLLREQWSRSRNTGFT